MATFEDVQQAIFDRVADEVRTATPQQVVALAEAFAWAAQPAQPHGGSQVGRLPGPPPRGAT